MLATRGGELGSEDDIVTQMGWRAALAKVRALRGDLEEAQRLAREAEDLGEGTDYVDFRAQMWLRLGEVLRAAGKRDEAAQAVFEALALFERKGNEVMVERARRELTELGSHHPRDPTKLS